MKNKKICVLYCVGVLIFSAGILGLARSVFANVEFTADTIISLSGISDGTLYAVSGSQADSLSVSGSTLTVSAIPDGQNFTLKTSQYSQALSLIPTGGIVDLTFSGSNLNTSSGTISSWTLTTSGSPSVAISLGVPKASTNYTIATNGDTSEVYVSNTFSQISFTYNHGNFTDRVFTVTEGGTVTPSSSLNSIASAISNFFTCTNIPPNSAPWLYGAIPQDGNSITIYFTNAQEPYDRYVLEYGTTSGSYQYSVGNMGGQNLRIYKINSLLPDTKYYFRVRAGNGCMPGSWSNELSAKTKALVSLNQLNIDSTLVPQKIKDKTDAKTTNSNQENSQEVNNKMASSSGVLLKIKVTDTDKKPVKGAKVTLHSQVREKTTDLQGIAEFENVEKGEHTINIAYDNYRGEQTVNLTGDYKQFNLDIQVKPQNILVSPSVIVLISIIILLLILLIKRRKNSIKIKSLC